MNEEIKEETIIEEQKETEQPIIETPKKSKTPLIIICQIKPKIIPPIKFGIKNIARKKLVNFFPLVNNRAIPKAKKLIVIIEIRLNKIVFKNAF